MTSSHTTSTQKSDKSAELAAVLDTVIDGVISIEENGTIISANKAVERILQYKQTELIGKNINVLMPEPYRSKHDGYLLNYLTSGNAKIIGIGREVQAQRKDGSIFDMELGVSELVRHQRRIFIGTIRDITDRKQAELEKARAMQALDLMAKRFELAAKSANLGVWEFNVDSCELIWDDIMYEIHGLAHLKDAITLDDWTNAIDVSDRDKLGSLFSINHSMSDIESFEAKLDNQENTTWIKLSARAVTDASANATQIVGTVIDITASKLADDLKSQFLATMSHEIRTPMNGIVGILQILKESELSQKQLEYLSLAEQSTQSLSTIINDILDFSKIEAGQLEIEYIEFNLHRLLKDIAQLMGIKASEKNLPIKLNIDSSVPEFVEGDPGRLRQIITNLLSNAIKFTQEGEIRISMSLTKQSKVLCSVEDTGIGIPEDKITSLFTRFQQVDASTTRKFGGTGLGLSICKELVNLFNGSIWVESTESVGSVFSFTADLPEVKEPNIPDAKTNISDRHAWIIDDSQTLASSLSNKLTKLQITADIYNGHKPLLTADLDGLNLPDYVFVNFTQSGLNPQTLINMIKRKFDLLNTDFIYLTGTPLRGESKIAKNAGFMAFLTWPLSTENLKDALSSGSTRDNSSSAIITKHNASSKLQGRHILIAEDNSINQTIIANMVESFGALVTMCADGKQTIDTLKNKADKPWDIILMDCQMPIMDGFEATKHIRAGEAGQDLREITIIAVTANAMDGDKEACISAGMNDYISKPIDKDALQEKLNEWISAK